MLFFSLVTTVVPPKYDWIKPVLTLLAAILSAVSLVSKNEKNAIDCQDLHFRWLVLATDYEKLWNDVYADDASERYDALRLREAEISRSSTAMPQKNRLLSKVQANVTMHHSEAAA